MAPLLGAPVNIDRSNYSILPIYNQSDTLSSLDTEPGDHDFMVPGIVQFDSGISKRRQAGYCISARNQCCEDVKINKCTLFITTFMEAAYLIQPWIATRTIADYCRLCYQPRDGEGFMQCERAHLAGFKTLLATLKMEMNPQFGDAMKHLEDAKETCLSIPEPSEHCYEKMQNTLNHTPELYDQMLDEYKNKYAVIPARPSTTPRMQKESRVRISCCG